MPPTAGAAVTPLEGVFDEQRIVDAFGRFGLTPHRWSNAPHHAYPAA